VTAITIWKGMRDYNALFLSVRHFFSLGRFTSSRT